MMSFDDLLTLWTVTELAADLSVPYPTAGAMRRRGYVAVVHWPRLVDAAARKGIQLTMGELAEMAASRRGKAA